MVSPTVIHMQKYISELASFLRSNNFQTMEMCACFFCSQNCYLCPVSERAKASKEAKGNKKQTTENRQAQTKQKPNTKTENQNTTTTTNSFIAGETCETREVVPQEVKREGPCGGPIVMCAVLLEGLPEGASIFC